MTMTKKKAKRGTNWAIVSMLTVIGLLAMIGMLFFVGGCELLEPKVTSPWTGHQVTEAGLTRERIEREEQARAKAEAEQEAAKAAVRRAQADAKLAAANVTADLAVGQAEAQRRLGMVAAQTEQAVADAGASAAAARAALAATLASIDERADAAYAEIDANRSKLAAVAGALKNVPVVGQALGSWGLDPAVLVGVLGGGALVAQQRRKTRAVAAAKADRDEHDQTWDEARADLIRTLEMLGHATPARPPSIGPVTITAPGQ